MPSENQQVIETSHLFKDPVILPDINDLKSLDTIARLGYPDINVGNNDVPQINLTVEALDGLLALLNSARSPNQAVTGNQEYGFYGLGRRDGYRFYIDSWYLLPEKFSPGYGAKNFSDSVVASALRIGDANDLGVVLRGHDHHEAAPPLPSGTDVHNLFNGTGMADMIVQSTRDPFTLGVYCPSQAAEGFTNLGVNIVNPRHRSNEDINNLLSRFAYYVGDEQVQITDADGSQSIVAYSTTNAVDRGQIHMDTSSPIIVDNINAVSGSSEDIIGDVKPVGDTDETVLPLEHLGEINVPLEHVGEINIPHEDTDIANPDSVISGDEIEQILVNNDVIVKPLTLLDKIKKLF